MRKRKLITLEGVCNGKSEASIDRDNERSGAVATAEEEEAQVCEAESVALGCDQGRYKANRQAPRQEISGGWRFTTDDRDPWRNAAHTSPPVGSHRRVAFAATGDPLKDPGFGEDRAY